MALIRGAAAILGPGGLLFPLWALSPRGTGTINRHFLAQRRNRAMISGYDAPDRRELGDRAVNVMLRRAASTTRVPFQAGENFYNRA